MSAITGIFYRDGRVVTNYQIKKMNDVLSHRGPDGSNVWCEGSVAMGHQMLWTTPESLNEKLPFEEEDLVITADARIDNRNELSEELGISDVKDVSDSYYILKAYQKWGEKCPEKLLGDFVFVIWDKEKEILFCARDHMGVKPFYYCLSDSFFIFASEIKALLTMPEIPKVLNNIRVAEHLMGMLNNRKITFYDKIERLPAANSMLINYNTNKLSKYWELDINKEVSLSSDDEYVKEFLKIFDDAVKCRLRSAFPLGSLLSGGLDSSSIVCIARNILAEKGLDLKTFSATFEGLPCDEQYFIKKVLEFGNLDPYFINADKISPLDSVNEILGSLNEPFTITNLYMVWNLYQEASKNEVRIVLDGFDGDTTLSHGQGFLVDLIFSFRWKKAINELNFRSKLLGIKLFSRNTFLMILDSIFLPLTHFYFFNMCSALNLNLKRFMKQFELLNKEFITETDITQKYIECYLKPSLFAQKSKEKHYLALNSGNFQYILEIADKTAFAENIEPRYPFLDRRLIEFCLALPLEQKINNGWSRIILRKAMEGILPPEIQWRKDKANLSYNIRKNLRSEKELLDLLLLNKGYLIKEFVDLEEMFKLYNNFMNQPNLSSFRLWVLITFLCWYDTYLKSSKKN